MDRSYAAGLLLTVVVLVFGCVTQPYVLPEPCASEDCTPPSHSSMMMRRKVCGDVDGDIIGGQYAWLLNSHARHSYPNGGWLVERRFVLECWCWDVPKSRVTSDCW